MYLHFLKKRLARDPVSLPCQSPDKLLVLNVLPQIGLQEKIFQILQISKSFSILYSIGRQIILYKIQSVCFPIRLHKIHLGEMTSAMPCALSLQQLVFISQYVTSCPFYFMCMRHRAQNSHRCLLYVKYSRESQRDQTAPVEPGNVRGHSTFLVTVGYRNHFTLDCQLLNQL